MTVGRCAWLGMQQRGITRCNFDLAQIKVNQIMQNISRWMAAAYGLSLSLNKTGVMSLTKKGIPIILSSWVGNMIVHTKPLDKYLGVLIDSSMSSFEHIGQTVDKDVTALIRLMYQFLSHIGPVSPFVWHRSVTEVNAVDRGYTVTVVPGVEDRNR